MAPKKEGDKPEKENPKKPKKGKQPHEIGGETITVSVFVNGARKYSRSATLADDSDKPDDDKYRRYTLDNAETLYHKRSLGIKELASELLLQ